MEAAVSTAVLSDAALRLPEMARIWHMALGQIRSYRSSRSSRRRIRNSRKKAQKAEKGRRKSHAKPQSRLRPMSPFSFVGQGRKGKTDFRIAAKGQREGDGNRDRF